MKTKTSTDERILAIAEPIAHDLGYNIVRIRVQGGKRATLQIMAEREDGTMSVEDCAKLSRELSSIFEVEDPLDSAYVLEISSPGIDRPLTELAHFEHYKGYSAKLELDRFVEGRKKFRGILAGTDGDNVAIDLKDEKDTALIPFEWLSEAKLIITDKILKAKQTKPNTKSDSKKETHNVNSRN